MNNNEYKKWYLIIALFAVIFTFFGGSLAYWQWTTNETERTSIALTVKEDFRCDADGGGDISNNEKYLVPTDCTNTDYAIQRTVTVTPTLFTTQLGVDLDLWLNINTIGDGLKNSNNFKYALTKSSTSCTSQIMSSGTFKGKSAGSTVKLLDKGYLGTITETYYLYIWLDKAETSTSTMEQDFDISLGGECIGVSLDKVTAYVEPEEPVLDEGMIPITLSDTGVATSADISSEWYNYEDREWANAVLVNSSVRSTYINDDGSINDGLTIPESDILAYYVWIPRYKYQIWTTSTSATGSEQTIQIVFESKDTAKSNGTAVGEFKTHPAFTFGSEELAGIWVGKFETTGDATTPTIKPNLQSLRSQNVSTQFQTSLKFAGGTLTNGNVTFSGSNTYGLTATTDSHMMKNSEWGAVAYLSRSLYGINQEIYINNSSGYYTGRSGGNVGGSTNTLAIQYPNDSTSTNIYNTYGYYTWLGEEVSYTGEIGDIVDISYGGAASTTGNITGVYDMSGGAWEYVMGVLSDSNGNPRSGYSTSYNSGFNGVIYDSGNNTSYTEGISFPIAKYYELYTTTNELTACNGSICFGHALSETSSWYGDTAFFVYSETPWFVRGGSYHNGARAGAFLSSSTYGYADSLESWRSVLVPGDGA